MAEFEKRSIVTWVLIGIVTCGIGFLILWVLVGQDIRRYRRDNRPQVMLDLILTILTCGLYQLYADWKWAKYINEIKRQHNLSISDNFPLICVVLDLASAGFISTLLFQDELNDVYDARSFPGGRPEQDPEPREGGSRHGR